MSKNILTIALAQYKPSIIKTANFSKVTSLLQQSLKKSPDIDLFVLPECFTTPYSIRSFKTNCEPIPGGETFTFLKELALENKITIVGGSIPELDEQNGNIYNTTMVFDKTGKYLTKYRKSHLYDVDIPGKITFKESNILTAGETLSHFHLESHNINIGLGICYDIRFPDQASLLSRPPINSKLLVYPGAFNTTTGPLHWETLARSRALDNQCFVAVCSPARDLDVKYHAYGHSMLVNPMGQVIEESGEDETVVIQKLNLEEVEEFRGSVPLDEQRRYDLYGDVRGADTK